MINVRALRMPVDTLPRVRRQGKTLDARSLLLTKPVQNNSAKHTNTAQKA